MLAPTHHSNVCCGTKSPSWNRLSANAAGGGRVGAGVGTGVGSTVGVGAGLAVGVGRADGDGVAVTTGDASEGGATALAPAHADTTLLRSRRHRTARFIGGSSSVARRDEATEALSSRSRSAILAAHAAPHLLAFGAIQLILVGRLAIDLGMLPSTGAVADFAGTGFDRAILAALVGWSAVEGLALMIFSRSAGR
jgi:hypothetical protein